MVSSINYPTIPIAAASVNVLTTNTPNRSICTNNPTGLVDPETCALWTDADITVFLISVVNAAGATVYSGPTQMAYVAPGIWEISPPASVWVTKAGPWLALCEAHGPAGIGDTLQRTFFLTGVESDAR